MIYRGQEISDKIWVTKFEETPVKEFDSNDFDLTIEELEELKTELAAKSIELTQNGVDFKNLRLNFYATEYRERDYGPDDESQCTVCFAYNVPETDEESKARIEKKKKEIDKQIEAEEKKKEAAKLHKENEISKAIDILNKNGFKVIR